MKREYNKLVRDRIPKIIEESGKLCKTRVLHGEKLVDVLNEKLMEEFEEYKKDGSIGEIADIIEVIYGILKVKGVSLFEFENLRREKLIERGGFEKGIFLEYVEE